MNNLLRIVFVVCVAYPVALVWLGITVRYREHLPLKGPAIIAANHNSHLDILTLLSLFPLFSIPNIQPIAAADYFFKNAFLKWFSLKVIGIIPINRKTIKRGEDPLQGCCDALRAGKILILFPEGTRGDPENLAELKSGIGHLAKRFPEVPIVPVFMHGLGRSLPKGAWVPIPLFISIAIGKPLYWMDDKHTFMTALKQRFLYLKQKLYSISDPL
ncbi:MAG: lysophospholipid acyltransferase family protein [Pseudomonadota bacterium]